MQFIYNVGKADDVQHQHLKKMFLPLTLQCSTTAKEIDEKRLKEKITSWPIFENIFMLVNNKSQIY